MRLGTRYAFVAALALCSCPQVPPPGPCEQKGCPPTQICNTTTHACESGTRCEATGCGAGQHCDTSTGLCAADPGSGCEVTGCPAGEQCNTATHVCGPAGGCPSECAPAAVCVAGTCTACRTDRTCTAGYTACGAGTDGCSACRSNTCPGDFPYCTAFGCSQCQTNADCGGATPYCNGVFCMQCRTDGDCSAGQVCYGGSCTITCTQPANCPPSRPVCTYAQQWHCTECDGDEQCPPGEACYAGTCRHALAGDSCSNAIPLLLDGTTPRVLDGTVTHYGDGKVWYALTVPQDSEVTLVAGTSLFTNYSVGLYARCDDENGYGIAYSEGAGQAKIDRFAAAGVYFVKVGAQAYSYGGYTDTNFLLTLSAIPAARAAGNDCSKAIALQVGAPGGQQVTVAGDTTGMLPLPEAACSPDAGAVAYTATLQENSLVRAALTPARSDVDLALLVDPYTCWDTMGCGLPAQGAPVTKEWKDLPPGPVSVLVQTRSAAGPYSLSVETKPYPINNTCAKAFDLGFDGGVSVVQVSSDTTDVTPTYAGCDTFDPAPAVHYRFSTAGLGQRSIQFDLVSSESDAGRVSMTSICPSSGILTSLDCGQAQVDEPRLAEGTYQVQVQNAGHFTLRAALGPPVAAPPGDLCTSPVELSLDGGSFGPVSGTTRGATSDSDYDCGLYRPDDNPSRDVVFHLLPPGRGILTATVTPTDPAYDPFVQIASTCYDNLACGIAQPAGVPETASVRVSADTYVRVDSEHQTEGDFTLQGSFAPAAANDLCADAATINFGQTVTGTIDNAFFDPNGCDTSTEHMMNLFYKFTAPSNGTATVTLVPQGFDGVLGHIADCTAYATCAQYANAGLDNATETLTFAVSRNTTYTLMLGGRTTMNPQPKGTFSLTLAGP